MIEEAVRRLDTNLAAPLQRGFADPLAASQATGSDRADAPRPPMGVDTPEVADEVRQGTVVVVWGPAGAPGRSTVAIGLADELSRLGRDSLIVDADVYGGVVAPTLGLLDESPGLAAACRQAGVSRLGPRELAGLCWQLAPNLRVLTGIPRADRWPELRASAAPNVLSAARRLADYTVVDVGFCLEADEELSYDTIAPRRNGLTLAMLDAADLVIAVGSADPVGVQRLVRGLSDLRDVEVAAPIWVVVNRVRADAIPGDPARELSAALDRFAGRSPAALLPLDQDAVDAAIALGRSLADARPSSRLRQGIAELARAVAGVEDRPRRRHGRRRSGRSRRRSRP